MDLKSILESSPYELNLIIPSLSQNSINGTYARILKSYFLGRTEELAGVSREIEAQSKSHVANELLSAIQYLCILRIKIIDPTFSLELNLPNFDDTISKELPNELLGEMHFVYAMYLEGLNNDQNSKDHYLEAQKLFFENHCPRKAAKSFHNSIACESRIRPNQRLLPEYQIAANMAFDAGDMLTAAAALNNLSREYHLMGAKELSLKTADESIELFRKSAFGNYSYHLALCHRAQLHLELQNLPLARLDIQEASMSQIPTVQAAVDKLKSWMPNTQREPSDSKKNTPLIRTWSERSKNGLSQKKLSEQENKLIESLREGPVDRFDLILKMWGPSIDPLDADNRLKQVFHRLRKKRKDIVGFLNSKYFILESAGTPTLISPNNQLSNFKR